MKGIKTGSVLIQQKDGKRVRGIVNSTSIFPVNSLYHGKALIKGALVPVIWWSCAEFTGWQVK